MRHGIGNQPLPRDLEGSIDIARDGDGGVPRSLRDHADGRAGVKREGHVGVPEGVRGQLKSGIPPDGDDPL